MNKIVLVTGGGGFLGKALCKRLQAEGYTVRALQRGRYPELEAIGIECYQENLTAPSEKFQEIFDGVSTVFHVAAKVDMWGAYDDFYSVNVTGTRTVLAAAQAAGVPTFVYTSSPSVIASGKDLRGIDESEPYPDEYKAYYPRTKAIAEREVLAAHSTEFKTCALRPHLIWGPGDTNLIPTVLERARAGRLLKVGDGTNVVDVTYIDDCVQAHLCAMNSLANDVAAGGKAYFISQGDPVPLWDWIDEILIRHNLPRVTRSINARLAYCLAIVFEFFARILPGNEPLFSRFLVEEMSTDHYFDISRAKKLLQYTPARSVAEALEEAFPMP